MKFNILVFCGVIVSLLILSSPIMLANYVSNKKDVIVPKSEPVMITSVDGVKVWKVVDDARNVIFFTTPAGEILK